MEILETVTQDGHRKRKASREHSDAPIAKRPKIILHQDVYAKRMEDIIIKTHKVKTAEKQDTMTSDILSNIGGTICQKPLHSFNTTRRTTT
jgi:hypothetical protein